MRHTQTEAPNQKKTLPHGGQHPGGHSYPEDACGPACGSILSVRNRYFTGKYLTARDFQDEQEYFLSRHRLHNRLLHGWGIVCGLVVAPHPNPNCADHVVVSPGIAIDCCGREIVLKKQTAVRIWRPEDVPAPEQQPPEEPEEEYEPADELMEGEEEQEKRQEPGEPYPPERPPFGPFLLYIRYCEECIEQVPALYSEEACNPRQMEANRVREVACLEVLPWDETNRQRYAGCWFNPEDAPDTECRDDCADQPPTDPVGCLEPLCQCDLGVPLALLEPQWENGHYRIVEGSIQTEGRHDLQTPPEYLTHIVWFNWPHGGVVPLSELRGETGMNGQLRVRFDRRLLPAPEDSSATGINEHTFIVQYYRRRDIGYSVYTMFKDYDPPRLADDDPCEAVFNIDRRLLEDYETIGNHYVYVRLKCDFIMDCHGRLVDGDHLKGETPTGDGTPGGTFESWFFVEDDTPVQRPGRRGRGG